MKKNKLFYLLICLVVLLLLGFQILDTYGVFESNITNNTSNDLAKWQILINGSNVTDQTSTFTINTISWNPNSGVASGKAAPGLSGFFEIIINPTGSEVSIEYEITMDMDHSSNSQIIIESVKDEDGTPLSLIDTNKYYGLITLDQIILGEIKTIRVDVVWNNDEGNNLIDSGYIDDINPVLDIPITVRLVQYTN